MSGNQTTNGLMLSRIAKNKPLAAFWLLWPLLPAIYTGLSTFGTPMEPATSLIRWQAENSNGEYFVTLTQGAVLLNLLVPALLVAGLLWSVVHTTMFLRGPKVEKPQGAEWLTLESNGRVLSAIGASLLPFALIVNGLLLRGEHWYSTFGQGTIFALNAIPLMFLIGWLSLLNLLLPAHCAIATVAALKPVLDRSNSHAVACELVLDNDLTVRASLALAQKVQPGMFVYLSVGAISNAVREVALKTATHYREVPSSK